VVKKEEKSKEIPPETRIKEVSERTLVPPLVPKKIEEKERKPESEIPKPESEIPKIEVPKIEKTPFKKVEWLSGKTTPVPPWFRVASEGEKEKEIKEREEKIPLQEIPKRPSALRKFLVRIGILLLILSLAALFYWYSEIKKLKEVVRSGEKSTPKKEVSIQPEIPSLLPTERLILKEISKPNEVLTILNQIGEENLPPGDLARIVIKDKIKGREFYLE